VGVGRPTNTPLQNNYFKILLSFIRIEELNDKKRRQQSGEQKVSVHFRDILSFFFNLKTKNYADTVDLI
jgi:hypothetical protein